VCHPIRAYERRLVRGVGKLSHFSKRTSKENLLPSQMQMEKRTALEVVAGGLLIMRGANLSMMPTLQGQKAERWKETRVST
jgi:hypothetical protein